MLGKDMEGMLSVVKGGTGDNRKKWGIGKVYLAMDRRK